MTCLSAESFQLCLTLCDPKDCSPPADSPGGNTGVGYQALLQGDCPQPGMEPNIPWLLRLLPLAGGFFMAEPAGKQENDKGQFGLISVQRVERRRMESGP